MLHELADTFGCSKQSAWIYADRPDFPKPLDSLKAGKIWKLIEVEAWGKRYLLAMERRPTRRASRSSRRTANRCWSWLTRRGDGDRVTPVGP